MQLDAHKATTHEMAVATAPIDTPVGVLAGARWRHSASAGRAWCAANP